MSGNDFYEHFKTNALKKCLTIFKKNVSGGEGVCSVMPSIRPRRKKPFKGLSNAFKRLFK
jgi:hypothetical protein